MKILKTNTINRGSRMHYILSLLSSKACNIIRTFLSISVLTWPFISHWWRLKCQTLAMGLSDWKHQGKNAPKYHIKYKNYFHISSRAYLLAFSPKPVPRYFGLFPNHNPKTYYPFHKKFSRSSMLSQSSFSKSELWNFL